MVEFKSPSLSDYNKFAQFFFDEGEFSCEMNFISIYIWKAVYENKFFLDDKTLFFKSRSEDGGYVFSLPYGDIEYGMNLIFDYCKKQGIRPDIWTSQGKRLEKFLTKYDCYKVIPERDNFDYIYKREDLANLAGKKYHSKRNHISAFSKKYNWTYEVLSDENKQEFLDFSEKWYYDRADAFDEGLAAEQKALKKILNSNVGIDYRGALIRVDGKVVAVTLGSPINSKVFDIHFEKADSDYLTAYSLINREFAARELGDFEYINREDDLGIEGLRRAKLSYKPEILLEKYSMIYSGE